MVDSGASTLFINKRFVRDNHVLTRKLKQPIQVYNIDGTLNKSGAIEEVAILNMKLGDHEERTIFTVTDIGPEDVIIGIDWLRYHNPTIDWYEGIMRMDRCPDDCKPKDRSESVPAVAKATSTARKPRKALKPRVRKESALVEAPVDEEAEEPEELEELPEGLGKFDHAKLEKLQARAATTQIGGKGTPRRSAVHRVEPVLAEGERLFVMASHTYSSDLAEAEFQAKPKKTFEELVPEEYRRHAHVFSEAESNRLPEHKSYDHMIELVPEAKGFHAKVYPLSQPEQIELDKFIQENLEKGYIRPSKSPMSSPFFFVKKKDGKLRPVQDYRKLNDVTIKNRYPLPLISELMDRLKGAKLFTKLDVRWGYNNIRIKEGDEYKAAFVTNRGLFEPTVMFFGMTNSPATFQNMMNDIFADLVAEGKVTIYLDDILIYSKDLSEHRKVVHEVLQRLKEHDLFLKPEKCEFERAETEYLGVIISENQLRMDPIKVKAVADWPTPQNASDIRRFRGFANFYRRFIKDFGKICKPLDRLTGKVPWEWGNPEQEAFDELRRQFTAAPVLAMWDFDRPTRVETDASGFAVGGVLEQQAEDGTWHPVAYRSEAMTETERNYEIYDRELMAIVRAFEDWRHYLEGLPGKFVVFSDHKNLEYWKTARNLTRRQARWSLFLSRFHFEIIPKPGKTMGKSDTLSRQGQHEVKDEEDNLSQVVLNPEMFRAAASQRGQASVVPDQKLLQRIRECSEKDVEVAEALAKVQNLGPRLLKRGLEEWNTENGLLLFRGKVYVPKDLELRKELVRLHHDIPAVGHPGRYKTLELLSRNYWWPSMSKFVHEYVDTCDICQRTKIFPAPLHAPLKPLDPPNAPWESVTTDFIVKLPESEGFDSITVVVDRTTAQTHFYPCRETMKTPEHVQGYISNVFRYHGLPKQMISDRGSVFASKFLQALYEAIGIKSSMSTAYHPQTDGKTERVNQEIEQYLRTFCAYRQDDWVQWLPIAEFALNSRVHSSTGKAPFELIYGYIPEFQVPANPTTMVPEANERLRALKEAQEDAKAALQLTAERMKRFFDHGVLKAPQFEVGNRVYLERERHPKGQPTSKLAPKRDGPYQILEKIGDLNYRLKLTVRDQRHPVFHVDRLRAAKPAKLVPNREFPEPAPVVVDEEEEYEVEKILDSRMYRRKLQYKVKWKGYPDTENSWEPADNLEHAKAEVNTFHRQNPAAPRRVAASLFLAMNFRPINENFETAPEGTLRRVAAWEDGLDDTLTFRRKGL